MALIEGIGEREANILGQHVTRAAALGGEEVAKLGPNAVNQLMDRLEMSDLLVTILGFTIKFRLVKRPT